MLHVMGKQAILRERERNLHGNISPLRDNSPNFLLEGKFALLKGEKAQPDMAEVL